MYLDFLNKYSQNIQYNHSSLSAFRSGGAIKYYITPKDPFSIIFIIKELKNRDIKSMVCGNFTNILIKDNGYNGAIINMKDFNIINGCEDGYYAQGGASLSKLSHVALKDSFTGLEEFCDIPRTIGGAICMNAGAYGREMSDVIEYVDVIENEDIIRLNNKDLKFSYRNSIIKEKKLTVLGAKFALEKSSYFLIENKMRIVKEKRKATQPGGISLGSVFKKINGKSAGFYIEASRLKGLKLGGAMVSKKHANFIINVDRAKSIDFINLSKRIKMEVDNMFNIQLEYEVLII